MTQNTKDRRMPLSHVDYRILLIKRHVIITNAGEKKITERFRRYRADTIRHNDRMTDGQMGRVIPVVTPPPCKERECWLKRWNETTLG